MCGSLEYRSSFSFITRFNNMPPAPAKNSKASRRTGHYQRQPTGYRAFLPTPLPPDPPIAIEGELQTLLSQADRALGRVDGVAQTLPNPDLFVFMHTRKEAVLSSQIEGTQSSLHDLLAAEAKFRPPGQPDDVREVLNYVNAMNYGLNRLAELPLSIRLIKEIHERLLAGVRGGNLQPGELRTSQNWIGPPGCTLNEANFVPPPPHEVLAMLGDLEKYMHRENNLPPLIQIGLIHAQFETIHPFLDGNGRVGRLLITFLLCQQKILLKPILYLSYFFKQHHMEYYAQLQSVRENDDWEGWLIFFLRGVVEVGAETTRAMRSILAMREQHRTLITTRLGRIAGNGLKVLEHLYQHPILPVGAVREITGTSYTAANHLVVELTEAGILEEITGRKRSRLFRYSQYLRIFEETPNRS